MANSQGKTTESPKGVEDDLWSKPDETINEKIKDLVRLAKHKIHVCWYGSDLALLGRRLPIFVENDGRAALGRNGLDSVYSKEEDLIEPLDSDDPKGKLRNKNCKRWADQKGGIRHGYQAIPDALDYYLKQMTANCDKR